MNIDRLRYFIEISRSKSLSEAVGRLYISQQGLTKAVADMESELGVKLLNRSHNGVSLTSEGERFAKCADDIVGAYDNMLADIDSLPEGDLEAALTGSRLMITPYVLEALMHSINLLYPGSVHEQAFTEITRQMASTSCGDMAFVDVFTNGETGVSGIPGFPEQEYSVESLFRTSIGLVLPSEHPLATEKSVTIDEAADLPFAIVSDKAFRYLVHRLFGERGLANIIQEARSVELFADQVQKRRSPGLLDSFAYWLLREKRQLEDDVCFVPLDCDFVVVVCAVCRRNSERCAAYTRFAKYVKRLFQRNCSHYFEMNR